MLATTQRKKLSETFKMLSTIEKQVIALKIICSQDHDEKKMMLEISETGLVDSMGNVFTEQLYRILVLLLDKQGFLRQKGMLSIHPELHHDLLVLMKDEEMIWVYAMVDRLYKNERATSYSTQNIQIQTLMVKSLYANDPTFFDSHQNNIGYCTRLAQAIQDTFKGVLIHQQWLESRHKVIRTYICIALLSHYYCDAAPVGDHQTALTVFSLNTYENTSHNYLEYYSAIIHLSVGHLDAAIACCHRIANDKSGYTAALQATFAFLDKQFEKASKCYRKALAEIRKGSGFSSYYFDNILGVFHSFCVLYIDKNSRQLMTNAINYNKYSDGTWAMPMHSAYWLFPMMSSVEEGDLKTVRHELHKLFKAQGSFKHPLLSALFQLVCYMVNNDHLRQNQDELYRSLQQCIKNYQYLATLLLSELLTKTESYQAPSQAYLETTPTQFRVLDFIHVKETWEYSFQALQGLLLEGDPHAVLPAKTKRLMWLVDPDKHMIDVLEQTMGKYGKWSVGRAVNLAKLKHFHGDPHFDYLSPQDKLVISGIIEKDDLWYDKSYSISPWEAFIALIGHPHIAHCKNRDVRVELVAGEPELHIEEKKQGFHLSLSHFMDHAGLILEPETMNKYRVIDFSKAFASIAQIITKQGLIVPTSAKDKVLKIIQNAKRDIKIHADIKDLEIIPEIPGEATPCVQLLPMNTGVRATIWVKPLAIHDSYFKLGEGKESFMTLIEEHGLEKRVRIQRDLLVEKKHLKKLLAQCPSLSQHEYETCEYDIEAPEDVLEVISELQQYATTHPLTFEWPEGQSFKIKQRVNAHNLSLNISSNTNWFEYDGKITLDDGEVIVMQELLESLIGRGYGRFIPLGNGEFIELTGQLKKQLSVLHALSDGQKINPLGAQALSEIVAQVENTTFDAGWAAHVKKIKTMRHHVPDVPSTMQATLRDYQVEGFQYLSRLTHWGIGACLADDMGLGKTVQTIALLLERAKNGPSLVIAPTSVCFNWHEELIRFAPTLNIYDLRSGDRDALITQASPFDVILCSYGLLQHNSNLLSEKPWETIVLDEAQAIKNAQTQRWKSVMKLKGENRIALSGTPIENHLGELWSIFSFLNPGLLGSMKQFQNKYSIPIETKQAPDRIHALRSLVQPYILRRIKSNVLSELPPKTEQTIYIEPSEEEATFYEAVRRIAEDRMVHFMAENNRISALAEITKLRLACCDSSLVDSSVHIENSKLNTLIETLKNIIENGHKVLVFSQYVSFLKIIRKRMEDEKIDYQYLDGTTSAVNRKKSVVAFQAGEGDVFLLSLKAGGSGLNLTAADYVIHLDPWWNPAVEDQASDRAHRIGQERPVTIYRLITRNTIEEKIIALHEHKRNLANELLSGQGVSGKLSNADLMNLIAAEHCSSF
ncbi:MAG: DEAD/DEAH box helicase [Legionellales bacterium]|nr:DEAD/DEAH box helicase [Legionellales bacterium]